MGVVVQRGQKDESGAPGELEPRDWGRICGENMLYSGLPPYFSASSLTDMYIRELPAHLQQELHAEVGAQ